jgi:predicted phage terminase large subunit-like protein
MAEVYVKYKGMMIPAREQMLINSREKCKRSLAEFVRQAWHVVEPGAPYIHGWHVDFICAHLEAITDGEEIDGKPYNRLLINIPPGFMKSLLLNVFWPAWEWGPCNMPHLRYLCAAHSLDLSIRDATKMRRLVTSEWYQKRWPHVQLSGDQNQKTKFENTQMGFRQATAAGSITGARADRVLIDDPLSVQDAASEVVRSSTIEWFLEAVPTRLVNPERSVIAVIMQRLHTDDISGVILDKQLGYDHICLPMLFDPLRAYPTKLGYIDSRTEDGHLLFPERFPKSVVDRDRKIMGEYAFAGQMQQEPAPRGGGIIKNEWWLKYDDQFPPFDYILASLDTAYTTKTEGDYSAMTVWGVFSMDSVAQPNMIIGPNGRPMAVERTYGDLVPKVMLVDAWQDKLTLNDLVNRVAKTCRDMKVDKLLIESTAAGISVDQEIRRLYSHELFSVQLQPVGRMDKGARLHSISHLFQEGMIYAPDKIWADMVIQQVSVFPKGKNDDLVDTVSQALRHLRDLGMMTRGVERTAEIDATSRFEGNTFVPLYPV